MSALSRVLIWILEMMFRGASLFLSKHNVSVALLMWLIPLKTLDNDSRLKVLLPFSLPSDISLCPLHFQTANSPRWDVHLAGPLHGHAVHARVRLSCLDPERNPGQHLVS